MRLIWLFVLIKFWLRAETDWPSFGNDPGAMRYSPLRQIDASNVVRLRPAWTPKSRFLAGRHAHLAEGKEIEKGALQSPVRLAGVEAKFDTSRGFLLLRKPARSVREWAG